MNFKRTIIYLLLSIFILIFIYNYVLPYFALQNYNNNNMGMGMGKHMWEGVGNNTLNNYNNYNNFGSIISFSIVILVGFLLFDKIVFESKANKCKKCGLTIESSLWKVCPRCGNHLYKRGEE